MNASVTCVMHWGCRSAQITCALDLTSVCQTCTSFREAILETIVGAPPGHSHREWRRCVTDSMPHFVPNVDAAYRR